MIKKLLIATLVASSFAAVPVVSMAQHAVVIDVAPPAPRAEHVPAARRGYVWVPGFYEMRGRHHVWTGGHWIKARSGYTYSNPQWVQTGNRWRLQEGRWVRAGRDNDGDGVRNRDDARPNNPNRS